MFTQKILGMLLPCISFCRPLFVLSCQAGFDCLSNSGRGGGGNLIGLTYGDVPLFTGTYSKKCGIMSISF